MVELQRQLEEAGGTLALHSRVVGGAVPPPGAAGQQLLRLHVRDEGSGEGMELAARAVVNSAGLYAQVGGVAGAGLRQQQRQRQVPAAAPAPYAICCRPRQAPLCTR